jgi:hypothetical protein
MCVLDVRVVVRDDGGARRIARRVAERELNHARGADAPWRRPAATLAKLVSFTQRSSRTVPCVMS